MLLRRDAELAHLFFHELTHRTLWVPHAAAFNENLAEYVAVVLTRQYLQDQGDQSALDSYDHRRKDKELFSAWLEALRRALQTLYDNSSMPVDQMLRRKAEILSNFQKPPVKPNFKQVDLVGSEVWNNASIMSASLYTPDFQSFDQLRQCMGRPSMREFLDMIGKQLEDFEGDPMSVAMTLCTNQSIRERAIVD